MLVLAVAFLCVIFKAVKCHKNVRFVILFIVAIGGMVNAVCPLVSASLYTDDVAPCCSSQNLVTIKFQLLIGSAKWIFLLHSKDPVCTVGMIAGFLNDFL